MAKVSRNGEGKTLCIELSIYSCGSADTATNLTISCPAEDTRFKTTLSDKGLQKFKKEVIRLYALHE